MMDIKKILFKTNEFDVEKSLPDGAIFCNKDGKIQWVNDKVTELFITSKMHLMTSNVTDFIENALIIIKNAIETNSQVIVKLTENETYFNMTAREVENGYVLMFRDVIDTSTSQQINNKKREALANDKNEFLLKLANDFKSPLQSIVGFSQAMSDGLGGEMSPQQDKYIKIIRKNSADLMYFIEKLLDFTKIETENTDVDYKLFDLINSINSVIKYNEQLYKEKNIRLNFVAEGGLKNTIMSDESIVKSTLQNVLEVVYRIIEMGDVSINLSKPNEEFLKEKNIAFNDYVMISVSSSSILFSENDLESIFEPYNIVDTTNKKNLVRAMTLFCAKNLIEKVKGSFWIESKILKTTSFNILIPNRNC